MINLDKNKLISTITQLLESKIESLNLTIKSNKDSRDNETKSSAGDKYETGRAMMQMELDKHRAQLNKILLMQRDVERIDTHKEYDKVEFGSLVKTNHGLFFIAIALGKVALDETTVFCVSLASPLGHLLHQKTASDSFDFQGKRYSILEIQ